ncbi:MAG TPA: hypothetical protein VJ508_07575 [Saprospiraceae bacterium]|nr:hypothetical protein [Saprospiraceae bacterium]
MNPLVKTVFLLCALCLISCKSKEVIPPEIDGKITSMIRLKEDDKFIWAQTIIGVVKINKSDGKSWLMSPLKILLPSPNVTGMVMDNLGTYVSTDKGIVYWDGFCTLIITAENSDLPENDILQMKLVAGRLLIKTRHFGWYLGTGNPIKPFKLKKIEDQAILRGCNFTYTLACSIHYHKPA